MSKSFIFILLLCSLLNSNLANNNPSPNNSSGLVWDNFLNSFQISSVDSVNSSAVNDSVSNLQPREPNNQFAHGGLAAFGIWVGSNGQEFERPCTLSFPVYLTDNKQTGFLTSSACATNDIFVGDAKVGEVQLPRKFDSTQGLDYVFVPIYPKYWDNLKSPRVAFNEVFNKNKLDLLVVTTPDQSPANNTVVCAYGGESNLACGEIVEFGVTITVSVPGSGGSDTTQFSDVTKVIMNRKYNSGDLGAPIYIPLQVPFESQLIVAPVGQAIGNVGEKSERNVWYYIPIKKILDDSKLTLLVGDFKSSAVVINNSALPLSSVDLDNSASKLQVRQNIYPTLHCGDKVKIAKTRSPAEKTRACTLGFAIKRSRGPNARRFDEGFLTLASCLSDVPKSERSSRYDVIASTGHNNPPEILVGETSNSPLNSRYDFIRGFDYAILEVTRLPAWDNDESMGISTNDLNQQLPVIKTLQPINPAVGERVCYSASYTGLVCGNLLISDSLFTRSNPWAYLSSPAEDFLHTEVVALTWPPYMPFVNRRYEVLGAPVFIPVYDCNNPEQIVAAHPVGILVGNSLSSFVHPEVRDGQLIFIGIMASFYYEPLALILGNEPNIDLITSPAPPHQKRECQKDTLNSIQDKDVKRK